MLATFLQRILGTHALSVSKPDQITGRFNGHLLKNLLLVCEEAVWAGNKEAEGALKNLITESELTIEQKGLDAYPAPNYSRLLMISNNDWVVPVGEDPRRFFVLEVVNRKAADATYFDPIFEEMSRDGGGLQAMLFDLLEWDITSNLRRAPATDALRAQREQSLSSVERWLLDIASAGGVRDRGDGERHWLDPDGETLVSTDVVRDAAERFCGPDRRGLDRALGQLLKNVGVERTQVRARGGKRAHCYAFPELNTFRASVTAKLKVLVEGYDHQAGDTIH